MKEVIFFDIDDTLYRRFVPFREAFRKFFTESEKNRSRFPGNAEIPFPVVDGTASEGFSEAFIGKTFQTTQIRCEEVFQAAQRGEITKEEQFIYRYQKGFEDVGIRITEKEALKFREAYQEALEHIHLEPEVERILDACKENYGKIGLITNGQGPHQRKKIRQLELLKWVDPELIVISGEVGIDKPDPGIFRYAGKLAGLSAKNLTYVGDAVETDYRAALAAGWKSILWTGCNTKGII